MSDQQSTTVFHRPVPVWVFDPSPELHAEVCQAKAGFSAAVFGGNVRHCRIMRRSFHKFSEARAWAEGKCRV